MIYANHPFAVRGFNPRDENGNHGCAVCGRARAFHRDEEPEPTRRGEKK